MELSKSEKKSFDEFVSVAREKGYREESIEILIMLACSKNMYSVFSCYDKAFDEITKIIKESKDPSECLTKTLQLAGIEY